MCKSLAEDWFQTCPTRNTGMLCCWPSQRAAVQTATERLQYPTRRKISLPWSIKKWLTCAGKGRSKLCTCSTACPPCTAQHWVLHLMHRDHPRRTLHPVHQWTEDAAYPHPVSLVRRNPQLTCEVSQTEATSKKESVKTRTEGECRDSTRKTHTCIWHTARVHTMIRSTPD